MKRLFAAILMVLLAFTFSYAGTVTKGRLGKDDLHTWDGTAGDSKYQRQTPEGYTLYINAVDWPGVDVFQEYGGGVSRSVAAILSAVSAIGTVQNTNLWLSPGTWTITSGVTLTENFALTAPNGVSMVLSSGVTMWLQGPLHIGDYPVFDCSASGSTVYFLDSAAAGLVKAQWFNKNWNSYGLGKVPDSSVKLDVAGKISGETVYGIHTGSIDPSVVLPNPITSGVSTAETTTGGTFRVNLTSSETLAGKTVYGGMIANFNCASEVTGTVTGVTPGMSFSFENAGNTSYALQFNAADSLVGIANFSSGTSVLFISGVAGSAYGYISYLAPNKWIISGASVTTRNK